MFRNDDPVSFDGEYEQLNEAKLLSRPDQLTTILVGGNGRNQTMFLAAEYADERDSVFTTVDQFANLPDHMDDFLRVGRQEFQRVTKSVMTRVMNGRDETEVEQLLKDETDAEVVDDLH